MYALTLPAVLYRSMSLLGEYGLSYSNDDDLSFLTVDTEGQMGRFVAKNFESV